MPYPTFVSSWNIIFYILLSNDWDCVKEFLILTILNINLTFHLIFTHFKAGAHCRISAMRRFLKDSFDPKSCSLLSLSWHVCRHHINDHCVQILQLISAGVRCFEAQNNLQLSNQEPLRGYFPPKRTMMSSSCSKSVCISIFFWTQ